MFRAKQQFLVFSFPITSAYGLWLLNRLGKALGCATPAGKAEVGLLPSVWYAEAVLFCLWHIIKIPESTTCTMCSPCIDRFCCTTSSAVLPATNPTAHHNVHTESVSLIRIRIELPHDSEAKYVCPCLRMGDKVQRYNLNSVKRGECAPCVHRWSHRFTQHKRRMLPFFLFLKLSSS